MLNYHTLNFYFAQLAWLIPTVYIYNVLCWIIIHLIFISIYLHVTLMVYVSKLISFYRTIKYYLKRRVLELMHSAAKVCTGNQENNISVSAYAWNYINIRHRQINAHIHYQQEDSTFAEQNEVITWRGIKQISNGKKDTYLTLNSQHLFHPHTHTYTQMDP